MSVVELLKYTDRSIAIFGNTKPYKEHIIAIGGKFNGSLKYPSSENEDEPETHPGWIFPIGKKDKAEELVKKINTGSIKGTEIETEKKYEKKVYNNDKPTLTVTTTQFMALMSRVERLEQEVAMLREGKIGVSPAKTAVSTHEVEEDDEDETPQPKRSLIKKTTKKETETVTLEKVEKAEPKKTEKKTEKKKIEVLEEEDEPIKKPLVKKTEKKKIEVVEDEPIKKPLVKKTEKTKEKTPPKTKKDSKKKEIDTSNFHKVQLESSCVNEKGESKGIKLNVAFESEKQFEQIHDDSDFNAIVTLFDNALPEGWRSDDVIEANKTLKSSDKCDLIITHEMFPLNDEETDDE